MRKIPNLFYRITVLLLITIWVFSRYNDFFELDPSKVIEPWGDGFKAYTVIQYHARFDTTYSHYNGMNYPYGEQAVAAATQPLISFPLKWISENLVDISGQTVVIVNLLMLLGIVLSAFFLYLIFERLGLPGWYSVLGGLGITLLAPQIQRIGFHYGLAHVEVIPIGIYLLLRYQENKHWKWSAWIAIFNSCRFAHPFLFLRHSGLFGILLLFGGFFGGMELKVFAGSYSQLCYSSHSTLCIFLFLDDVQ